MKKVAILQSNYIPWKGYFDIINSVDEFIIFDHVQYTKNDWRNRNKIKTIKGAEWITIPVDFKNLNQKISETCIARSNWNSKHWKTLVTNYSKAPFFKLYKSFFEELYLSCSETNLSKINYLFLSAINNLLGINTKLSWSTDYKLSGDKSEVLLGILRQTGAKTYLSGPAAKDYLNQSLFAKEDIRIEWMDYSAYPTYNQMFPPFIHQVSILDLLFNTGPDFSLYMKSFQPQ